MTTNNKSKIIKKIGLAIVATLFVAASAVVLEYFLFKYPVPFTKTRLLIYGLIEAFVLFNIFYDYRKIWNWIFRFRYLIGIIIFVLLVALGFHTSSMGQYAIDVQPHISNPNDFPLWGNIRSIRSDEFLANTPTLLSQAKDATFNENNDYIMGTLSPLLLFPKVATINLSVLASPYLWGFFFLPETQAYAFFSLLPYFVSFFAVFELLLLITNKKKLLSLCGTMMLCFSPSILWWNAQNYFAWPCAALILFYKLLINNKWWQKLLLSLAVGWLCSCYVILSYPAWQVPFGYMYLVFVLYIVIHYRKEIKPINFLYLFISLFSIAIIILPAFLGSEKTLTLMQNTVYPGARNETGGGGWELLFNWQYSILYSIRTLLGNPCELTQSISLYPIPFIIAIIIIIINCCNKKFDLLLTLLTIVGILLNIWNYIPIGKIAQITLLGMSTPQRSQVVVSIISVFIIIRIISKYKVRDIKWKRLIWTVPIAIFILLISFFITKKYYNTEIFPNLKYLKIVLFIYFFIIICLISLNNNKLNKLLMGMLISISLFSFLTVFPITRGLSSINDKPVSKKIQQITKDDPNARWISINSPLITSNYCLANGAKIYNSVNFYPNLELWNKIDPNKIYENIYNRYAHITMKATKDPTSFELIQQDYFNININTDDLNKLSINYVASTDPNLSLFNTPSTTYNQIYNEDGSYIYKINYLN